MSTASASGRHDVGELVQRPAHVEPLPLVGRLDRRLGEDAIGDVVVELLELVERREVAVDDDVEQRVQREPGVLAAGLAHLLPAGA